MGKTDGKSNGVDLLKPRHKTTFQVGIKSVMKPFAQDDIPCAGSNELEAVKLLIERTLAQLEMKDGRLHALVEIQYLYGLRISEALSISHYDISRSGHIRIKGMKRSSDRIIVPVKSIYFFQRCKERNQDPFSIYNRFHIYREYKKLGIQVYFKENGKYSVTHLFRYLAAKNVKEAFGETELTKDFIGHKNVNNTKIYEEKE